jgi:hypothetical protein
MIQRQKQKFENDADTPPSNQPKSKPIDEPMIMMAILPTGS